MSKPEQQSSEDRNPVRSDTPDQHHAGAYGFSRIELRALIIAFTVVIVVGVWQSRTQDYSNAPSWIDETITVSPDLHSEDAEKDASE